MSAIVALGLLAAASAVPEIPAFMPVPFTKDGAPVQSLNESELAEIRGGFAIPNELEIVFAVDSVVMVDGHSVLQTQMLSSSANGEFTLSMQPLAPAQNGASVKVDTGKGVIRYASGDLRVTQLFGSALGTFVENSGNNRSIAVDTTVAISINNVDPTSLGGIGAAVGGLTSDIAALTRH